MNLDNFMIRTRIVKNICLLLAPIIIGCSSGSKEIRADFNLDGLEDIVFVDERKGSNKVLINYQDRVIKPVVEISYDQGISGLELKDYNNDGRPDVGVFVHQKGLIEKLTIRKKVYNEGNDVYDNTTIFSEE
ncbi:MAG: VCBS repeat-containing protein [archaeon]